MNACSSFVHNRQNLETTKMSKTGGCTHEVWCPYKGTTLWHTQQCGKVSKSIMMSEKIHTLNTDCIIQFIWLLEKTAEGQKWNFQWLVGEGGDCEGAHGTSGEGWRPSWLGWQLGGGQCPSCLRGMSYDCIRVQTLIKRSPQRRALLYVSINEP